MFLKTEDNDKTNAGKPSIIQFFVGEAYFSPDHLEISIQARLNTLKEIKSHCDKISKFWLDWQSIHPHTGAAWACGEAAWVRSSPQHLSPGAETELHPDGAGPGEQAGVMVPGPRGELSQSKMKKYTQKTILRTIQGGMTRRKMEAGMTWMKWQCPIQECDVDLE